MKLSLKIGKILDIPIRIHISFLVIIGLFIWIFSFESITFLGFTIGFGALSLQIYYKIILGALLSISLFSGVLLHELGHSYIFIKNGYHIESITLFVFGGVSNMEESPKEPKLELKMAVAGPLISLFIGFVFFLIFLASINFQIIYIFSGTLAFYNFILGLFNLIPAFPTDGGRVLRSIFAMHMKYETATNKAATVGKIIAVAIAIFGFFIVNFWLVLIAAFIFFGASQEQKTQQISNALENVKLIDLTNTDYISVHPDNTVEELTEKIKNRRKMFYPVLEDDKLIGVIRLQDVKEVDTNKSDDIKAKDIMNEDYISVSYNEDTMNAFKKLLKSKENVLFVNKDEKFIGFVNRSDFIRYIKTSNI